MVLLAEPRLISLLVNVRVVDTETLMLTNEKSHYVVYTNSRGVVVGI